MMMPGFSLYNHKNAQTQIQSPNTQIHKYKHTNTQVQTNTQVHSYKYKYQIYIHQNMNIFAENTNPCGHIGMHRHREESTQLQFSDLKLLSIFMGLNQPLMSMAFAFSILN